MAQQIAVRKISAKKPNANSLPMARRAQDFEPLRNPKKQMQTAYPWRSHGLMNVGPQERPKGECIQEQSYLPLLVGQNS